MRACALRLLGPSRMLLTARINGLFGFVDFDFPLRRHLLTGYPDAMMQKNQGSPGGGGLSRLRNTTLA
jgi:hypothetical protein